MLRLVHPNYEPRYVAERILSRHGHRLTTQQLPQSQPRINRLGVLRRAEAHGARLQSLCFELSDRLKLLRSLRVQLGVVLQPLLCRHEQLRARAWLGLTPLDELKGHREVPARLPIQRDGLVLRASLLCKRCILGEAHGA